MSNQRCPGCMRLKQNGPVCEHCGHDERMPNAPHQLPVGTVLQGQYVVGKVLGQGGFGITYMGWDQFLGIPVAIKEYFPNTVVTRNSMVSSQVYLASQQSGELFARNRDRFVREARSLAKLGAEGEVPNIVRVQNLVQANNTAYIIMEYVRGINLRDYILRRGAPLSLQETLRFLLPVMEALEKIHANHIVHRDLSPDNIMVLPDGSTKLIDFGAAHEVRRDEAGIQSSTESVVKHGFAPPEQYTRRGDLDTWTDVYAMSATVYYCLTGTVPPSAPDRQFDGEEIPMDRVDPQLRDILHKGMELRIPDRIQTMAQLREGLCTGNPVAEPEEPGKTQPVTEKKPVTPPAPEEERQSPPYTAPEQEAPCTGPISGQEMPASPPNDADSSNPKGILALTAAVIVFVAGLIWFNRPTKPDKPTLSQPPASVQTVPETTVPPKTTVPAVDPDAWMDNILRHDHAPKGGIWGVIVEKPVFYSDILNTQIKTVTFLDTLAEEPSNSWDVSAFGNGTVKAWAKPNGSLYDLYIAAEGGINGKIACNYLFYQFTNLTAVDFGGAFHMENTTDMRGMFRYCSSLTTLDLSDFNTSKVTDMWAMFHGCSGLTALDLSSFDTTNVTNMGHMFDGCSGLTSLDLSGFDTANVTEMDNMFTVCSKLTSLDLSDFDTANVTSMYNMFWGCSKLTSLDLSGFDTTKVTSMGDMFDGCPGLTDVKNPVLNKKLPANQDSAPSPNDKP